MRFRACEGPVAYKPSPNMSTTFGVDLSRRYKVFILYGVAFEPSLSCQRERERDDDDDLTFSPSFDVCLLWARACVCVYVCMYVCVCL